MCLRPGMCECVNRVRVKLKRLTSIALLFDLQTRLLQHPELSRSEAVNASCPLLLPSL